MDSINILICEDERLFATELEQRLQRFGHNVLGTVSKAEEAISKAAEVKPDVVLMDINLSGTMDGVEAAKILIENYDIPSIFLTAYSDDRTLNQARQSRPVGYLVKPVQDRNLQMTLEFALKQYRLTKVLKEDLTQHSDKMETLVGSLAHHMNNSLMVVTSYLNWLNNCETIQEYERRMVQGAIEGCQKEHQIVQQLLSSSQIHAKTVKEVDLNLLIDEALRKTNFLAEYKIDIYLDIRESKSLIFADRNEVCEAIFNVLNNALEAIESTKGKITIRLSKEFVENPSTYNKNAHSGSFYIVQIKDTGAGISKENLKKIFDPFYTTKITRNALGLGLSVAYGVMHSHGGWITVESEENNGTEVKLYLPILNTRSVEMEVY